MNNRNHFSNNQAEDRSPFFNKRKNDTETDNDYPPQNIKVPVEIAKSTFDFSLSKNIKMNPHIEDIQDISWESAAFDYQVNLFGDILWLTSKLIAEITYTKKNDRKVLNQKLIFPWKKKCILNYIYPPILPLSNEKKHYEFTDDDTCIGKHEHYEQVIYKNEKPILDIISTKIVTSKMITQKNNQHYLNLNINCEIFYRLFQYQVIKIK